MSNPARELYVIFSSWRTKLESGKSSAQSSRGGGFLGPTRTGFRLLDEIDGIIDEWEQAGRNVDIHRKHLKAWGVSLIAYPYGWSEVVSAEKALPEPSMDALSLFADLVDMASASRIPPLAEDQIRYFVAIVRETLSDDTSLSSEFIHYIDSLISAVENAMSHKDAASLKEELEHLWIAVFAAEERSSEKGKWRAAAERFSENAFTQTVASIAGGIVTHALTSG